MVDLAAHARDLAIRLIMTAFGESGQVWLESESVIRSVKNGHRCESEVDLLQYLVSPGDVCVDVGANCGGWTYWMSKQVGPTGRVIAIEPERTAISALRRVIDKLRLTNVEIACVAAGDEDCQAHLVTASTANRLKSLATSHLLATDEPLDSAVPVRVATLGKILDGFAIKTPNFIKCDIEGAELAFFRGARSLLTACKPSIVCEIEKKNMQRFGYDSKELFDLLASMGYRPYIYTGGRLVAATATGRRSINYVFVHESHATNMSLLVGNET